MDIEEIKTLTQLMVDNDLSEIIIRDGERRILLRRGGSSAPIVHAVQGHFAPQPQMGAQQHFGPSAPAGPPPAPDPGAGLLKVASPMVGTFYSASSPEAPPFIRIGDRVNPESVVCIIEAMKVFNEIKAEVTGTVESIEVQNGSPVEFGQVLMRVRP